VLSSNSIPPEGVRYVTATPLCGENEENGNRKEYSSYLSGVIDVKHIPDKVLYFESPILGLTGSKYLNTKMKNFEGIRSSKSVYGETGFGRSDGLFDPRHMDSFYMDEDDDKPEIDENGNPKLTVYQKDAKIQEVIKKAEGLGMDKMPIDDYAQLRHWYRCGVDPEAMEKIQLEDGSIEDIPKRVLHGSLINKTLKACLKAEIAAGNKNICPSYPEIPWLEEKEAIRKRRELSESSCVKLTSIFSDCYKSETENTQKEHRRSDGFSTEDKVMEMLNNFAKVNGLVDETPVIDSKRTDKIFQESANALRDKDTQISDYLNYKNKVDKLGSDSNRKQNTRATNSRTSKLNQKIINDVNSNSSISTNIRYLPAPQQKLGLKRKRDIQDEIPQLLPLSNANVGTQKSSTLRSPLPRRTETSPSKSITPLNTGTPAPVSTDIPNKKRKLDGQSNNTKTKIHKVSSILDDDDDIFDTLETGYTPNKSQ
jgi:hypothetical protein